MNLSLIDVDLKMNSSEYNKTHTHTVPIVDSRTAAYRLSMAMDNVQNNYHVYHFQFMIVITIFGTTSLPIKITDSIIEKDFELNSSKHF
jgi:hypothetical protein